MRKNSCRYLLPFEHNASILISVISFSDVAVNIVFSAIIIRCGLSRCSVPLQIRKFRCRLGKPARKKTWRRRLFTSPRTRLRASRDLVMLLMTVLPPQPHSDWRWHHVDCLTLCNLRPTTTICVNTCKWVAMRSVATERYSVTLYEHCNNLLRWMKQSSCQRFRSSASYYCRTPCTVYCISIPLYVTSNIAYILVSFGLTKIVLFTSSML